MKSFRERQAARRAKRQGQLKKSQQPHQRAAGIFFEECRRRGLRHKMTGKDFSLLKRLLDLYSVEEVGQLIVEAFKQEALCFPYKKYTVAGIWNRHQELHSRVKRRQQTEKTRQQIEEREAEELVQAHTEPTNGQTKVNLTDMVKAVRHGRRQKED